MRRSGNLGRRSLRPGDAWIKICIMIAKPESKFRLEFPPVVEKILESSRKKACQLSVAMYCTHGYIGEDSVLAVRADPPEVAFNSIASKIVLYSNYKLHYMYSSGFDHFFDQCHTQYKRLEK